jgi:hypothetical protein
MSKRKSYPLSNGAINSKRMRIKTANIFIDDFLENPIMLKDHVRGSLNIMGVWQDVRVENDVLLGEPKFDLGKPEGKELSRVVEGGFLKGISIGGEILEAELADDNGKPIIEVTKFHLKEVSFVDVPSNKTCLVLYDKDMNVLSESDWTFSDLPVEKELLIKNPQTMDFKKIATELGLADTATESEILEALKAQGAVVSNFADFQKKQKADQVTEITSLIDACLADGRITDPAMKTTYLKLADMDYDTAKKTLESLTKPQSITQVLRGNVAAQPAAAVSATFADMSKNNPKGLAKLHKENPAAFAVLYEAQFGISLADDMAMVQPVPEV